MKSVKIYLTLISSLFIASVIQLNAEAAANNGPKFSEMAVVGDSLCDQGNRFLTTGGDTLDNAKPPYFNGRYTNGRVWVEYLADDMGLPQLKASKDGGLNFAYGGAHTGYSNNKKHIPYVGEQIDELLERMNGVIPDDFLVIICAGGNDAKEAQFGKTVPNLVQHVNKLTEAGARHILIVSMPPLSNLPALDHELAVKIEKGLIDYLSKEFDQYITEFYCKDLKGFFKSTCERLIAKAEHYVPFIMQNFPDFIEWVLKTHLEDGPSYNDLRTSFKLLLDVLSVYNNESLKTELDLIKQKVKVNIYYFDAYEHFSEVIANPSEYGIEHVRGRAMDTQGNVVHNPNEYVFFDAIHPTAAMHKIMAKKAKQLFQK